MTVGLVPELLRMLTQAISVKKKKKKRHPKTHLGSSIYKKG